MADNFVALRITATDGAKPDLDGLRARLDELKDRVATARAEVDSAEADAALADLDAKLDAASKKVASPRIDVAGASRAAAQVTAVEAEMDKLDAKAAESAGAQETAAAASAGAWEGAGEKVKLALVGVAVGAGLAVKGAMDFNAQTTRLVTSAGESAGNLDMVRQGMLAISAATNTSTSEMASGMYTVESAGFHGAQALIVLRAAAQGAKDEGAQLATVSNAVTDVLVDYHMKASQSAQATSELIAAVSHGKTTFEDFSGSMSNILPLASAMHLKLSDVTGVLAEMTAHGMSADRASQDEANAMRSLLAPTGSMTKEFKALGITSAEVHAKLGSAGLAGTMQWLSQVAQHGAGKIGQNYTEAMKKLMGTAPGLVTALMTTGENADATNKAIRGIAGASSDAKGNVDGFGKVSQTLAFQMGQAWTSVKDMGISLGEVLLPAVSKVVGPIGRLLSGIAGNKTESELLAATIGTVLAAAVGVKAVGAFKSLAGAITDTYNLGKNIAGMARKIASAFTATAGEEAAAQETAAAESESSWLASFASTAAGAVTSAARTLAAWVATGAGMVAQAAAWVAGNTVKVAVVVAENVAGALATAAAWVVANAVMLLGIGLIVIAVVAAVALIVTHWKQISAFCKKVFDDVLHIVEHVIDWIKSHWPLVLAILTGPIGIAVFMIVKYWHDIVRGVEIAIDWVRQHWPLILDIIIGPVGMAVRWVVQHWGQVTAGAQHMLSDVTGFFRSLPGRILSAVGDLGHLLLHAGEDVINGLIHGIESAASGIPRVMGSIAHSVESYFTGPLKILSPSRVFADHGANVVLGIAQGIEATTPRVIASVTAMGAALRMAGTEAVQGLAAGMRSMDAEMMATVATLGALASQAMRDKLEISSPSRLFARHGADTVRGFIEGVRQESPSVTAAMSRLAGTVAGAAAAGRPGYAGGGYGAYGGGQGVLEVRLVIDSNDSEFMSALMKRTRAMGGDPTMFQRKVAFQ